MEESSVNEEKIISIEIERLKDFKDHPFRVRSDRDMQKLLASIKQYGILSPLIVRPIPEGVYEIISGHRRKYAAQQLGYRKVPVIIRAMKDDEAVISMIDANLQREQIRPSEKAFAYKMKYDAIKRRSGRRKKDAIDYHFKGKRSVNIISEEMGDSPKQVQRYLKLTELIPEMLEMLDDEMISFSPAFEIAFLKDKEQKDLIEAMNYTQAMPSLSQAQRIKKLSQEETLTKEKMQDILSETKKGIIDRVTFKNEQLYRFFPRNYSATQMKREILEILKLWISQNWDK